MNAASVYGTKLQILFAFMSEYFNIQVLYDLNKILHT